MRNSRPRLALHYWNDTGGKKGRSPSSLSSAIVEEVGGVRSGRMLIYHSQRLRDELHQYEITEEGNCTLAKLRYSLSHPSNLIFMLHFPSR